MLRLVTTIILIAAALQLAQGCKKSQAPAPGYPSEPTAVLPPIPEDEQTQAKFDKALEKSGISDAERAVYVAELEKQSPKFGYELSTDKEFLKVKGSTEQGSPIQVVLVEVSNLKDAQPEPAGQVKMYLERLHEQSQVAKKAAEDKRKALERIDQGEITAGLAPATDPTGEWQSIGETREGEKHFLVEHDGKYYKMLSINKDTKTLHIQEIKEGKIERDVSLPYTYDSEKGQLTTTSAGGGPGDSFIAMEIPNLTDRLFLRPMYDTVFAFTVYRRIGRNPNEGAPPVRR
jgi:hypothetical protein